MEICRGNRMPGKGGSAAGMRARIFLADMKGKHIHVVGICGVTMAPAAKMFHDMGWKVTGSDKGFFPPMSDYLRKHNIPFYPGWHPERIGSPDMALIGNFIGMQNPEFLFIRERGIPFFSYPEMLSQYVIRDRSAVIAGTYGKTTITAAVAWIFEQAGICPSFMIGGIAKNFPDGVRRADGEWSIVEGDEYSTSRWDRRPKFFHYRPTHLILTATVWDHTDLYESQEAYRAVFAEAVSSLPQDGMLVYHAEAVPDYVIGKAACPSYPYVFNARSMERAGEQTYFSVEGEKTLFCTSLIGRHTLENLTAAILFSRLAGVPEETIAGAISSFAGIRRRLEVRMRQGGITVIDDLAHSPFKVRASIQALREWHPQARIRVVFEPNIGSRTPEAAPLYAGVFDGADEVIIPRLSKAKKRSDGVAWVEGSELADIIAASSSASVRYFSNDAELVSYMAKDAQKGDIVAFMGSHGFRGMIEGVISLLQ